MIGGCALNHGLEKVRVQKCGTSVRGGCAQFVTIITVGLPFVHVKKEIGVCKYRENMQCFLSLPVLNLIHSLWAQNPMEYVHCRACAGPHMKMMARAGLALNLILF